MSSRDGGEAAAGEAGRSAAAASPNRRAIMLGGVTVGAAGVISGRGRRQVIGGRQVIADDRPRTHPAIRRDAVPPPTVEPDNSVTVLPYSFYGSSGDDFARINTAFSMLPAITVSGHSYTVGRVNLGPFTYAATTKIVKPVSADLARAGPGTLLQPRGSGFPALSCHDPNTPPNGFGTYRAAAGTIRDLVIDGAKAGASSKGLDIGDGWGHKGCRLRIQNLTGEWMPSNAGAGQVMFGGVIVGDAQLRSANAAPDGWR